jgi:predicted SprT family Zn-dependent metalloprotease
VSGLGRERIEKIRMSLHQGEEERQALAEDIHELQHLQLMQSGIRERPHPQVFQQLAVTRRRLDVNRSSVALIRSAGEGFRKVW